MLEIHRHADAAGFLARAEVWLLAAEAENNLILGIAKRLRDGDHGYREPIYLATVESGGEVAGCAWRTPPFKLGLTRLPQAAIPLLVDAVAEIYAELPAVHGPEKEAGSFAELWREAKGVSARTGMRQRIYRLETLVPLARGAAGRLRPAREEDRALLVRWASGFVTDALPGETAGPELAAHVDRLIAGRMLYVWEDGELRSMIAAVGPTAHGIRVTYVYTPPAFRGRGYASACVAALSERLLAEGRRFCFLYTDLANPTSNSIYARIGYRPVCDMLDIDFDQPA